MSSRSLAKQSPGKRGDCFGGSASPRNDHPFGCGLRPRYGESEPLLRDDMDLNFSPFPSSISTGNRDEESVKVLILGSGPAGLAAALYTARANLSPVVLSGIQLGGQVALTYHVENYPGFPEGVGGMQLVDLFQKQAERFGARVEFDSAASVDLSARPFRVMTQNDKLYLAETIIIATGASANHLNVPGEAELTGRGVDRKSVV